MNNKLNQVKSIFANTPADGSIGPFESRTPADGSIGPYGSRIPADGSIGPY